MSSIKEGFAFFTLCLSQILWVLYLIWAFVFDDFLNLLHFPFPSKYWAAIFPSAIIFTFLCMILFVIIVSLIKTESVNSINLIEDENSVFKDKLTESSLDYMNDLKIEQLIHKWNSKDKLFEKTILKYLMYLFHKHNLY